MSQVSANTENAATPFLHLNYRTIPPRDRIQPMFCSHTLRICRVNQGKGIWTIGEHNYDIGPGDIFLLNNSEYRAVHRIFPPQDLVMIILEFEPRFIWSNYSNVFDLSYLKVFFERDAGFSHRLQNGTELAAEISSLIHQLEEEMKVQLPEYRQMVKVKLLNILVLLNRHYSRRSEGDHAEGHFSREHYEDITTILGYIDTHLDEHISLNGLSQLLHLSPAYVSKLFKRYNGLGLSQYIIKKRIEKSILLLRSTEKSILEIASLCGFNNGSNFYKAFKSVTGSIPTDYRPI